jgi:hypothetical protein
LAAANPTVGDIAYFLEKKGRESLKPEQARGKAELLAVDFAALVESRKESQAAVAEAVLFLEALRDPAKPAARVESIERAVADCRSYSKMVQGLARDYKLGKNVFAVRAFQADFYGSETYEPVSAGAYWSEEGERVARVAERYFMDRGAPEALAGADAAYARRHHPEGGEREAMCKAYENWMFSCVPMIEARIEALLGPKAVVAARSSPRR